MDNTISSAPALRPDVVSVETTARPTAPTPRVAFSEVLAGGARALARGAQATMQSLPLSPLMAVAVRPGSTTAVPSAATTAPEGPSTSASGTSTGGATPGDGSIEGTLAQDQEMNLYYLQIQEQVNAQNRTFSCLSNVMEVEHSTAKTAIGNIH
jgi:hypothetical protein